MLPLFGVAAATTMVISYAHADRFTDKEVRPAVELLATLAGNGAAVSPSHNWC